MSYQSRIPVEPEYLVALGQAIYNFTYLEGIVIDHIRRLGWPVPEGRANAHQFEKAFEKAIHAAQPPLSAVLTSQLLELHDEFGQLRELRNHLLHAHPYSETDGTQQLLYQNSQTSTHLTWPIASIYDTAKRIENAAVKGSAVFYGLLSDERPA